MSDAPIPFLRPNDPPTALPDPAGARDEPNGLLAAGGSLSPEWLLSAYARGIFPWFSRGQPILWWSPDPRCVLEPGAFVVSRSLGQSLRNRGYETRIDGDFEGVIAACAAPRPGADGTWITPPMRRAYLELHRLGHAHSFETWRDGELLGGLYGVRLGRVFCGESMFSRARDASKVALSRLVDHCRESGVELIDCQMPTAHLASLGATAVPRVRFLERLAALVGA